MKNLRIAASVIATIGLLVSTYLAWAKVTHQNVVCIKEMGDCNIVNSSSYSEWRGIPIAFIGMIGYAIILILLAIYRNGSNNNKIITIAFFCITGFGALYSLYLTYIELFRIHAICPWCLISALAMIGLFIIASIFMNKSKIIASIH